MQSLLNCILYSLDRYSIFPQFYFCSTQKISSRFTQLLTILTICFAFWQVYSALEGWITSTSYTLLVN
jgi:hypothetical protein